MKQRRFLKNCPSLVLVFIFSIMLSVTAYGETTDYQNPESWAYLEREENRPADCFLVCPTVYSARGGSLNMPLDNPKINRAFTGALNMERGIYSDTCRMYAPFYRQAAMDVYDIKGPGEEPYFALAYEDVRAAFSWYLEHENGGRPFVLAGFSQGADMCLRLMEEFFDEPSIQERLIACYAIGWRVTDYDLKKYPHLKMAESASDTGVIVSFNTESKSTDYSAIVPKSTLGINPLNWRTDNTYADASLNKGACFTDYSGTIQTEIPQLTGAYLDETRGTLKVDDAITPQDYPPTLSMFEDGVYHLYDYQFFYRNLQENVALRTSEFIKNN
ncbi:MAG: DUF3089 domain-containing protein [Lachnospiraceae bacterium]|nr:DUF3089 domain-containing protein [Lachnospiraceae bacterium]